MITPDRLAAFSHLMREKLLLVGVAGFGPATPSSRTRYATRLRYTPRRRRWKPDWERPLSLNEDRPVAFGAAATVGKIFATC